MRLNPEQSMNYPKLADESTIDDLRATLPVDKDPQSEPVVKAMLDTAGTDMYPEKFVPPAGKYDEVQPATSMYPEKHI